MYIQDIVEREQQEQQNKAQEIDTKLLQQACSIFSHITPRLYITFKVNTLGRERTLHGGIF